MTAPIAPSYATAFPFFPSAIPSWLPTEDAARILSYQVYEDIYWNVPSAFKLVTRGNENSPIYIPSGKVIVETINRYVGRDFELRLVPGVGSDTDQTNATAALTALFNRENFYSKFASNKRYGIMRGDWCFHITANMAKVAGSRLSITSLDPSSYFPMYNPDNIDQIIGCDIASTVVVSDKTYVRRLRYLKTETGRITSETALVEVENWHSLDGFSVFQMIAPMVELPPEITALPVYHIKNFEEPQNPFGSSEMRGLERIISAINQGISDEELALAMEGLGAYTTDAGAPVDENGVEVPWRLGPGRVIELPEGGSFSRVNGVNTVGPYQDHLTYLHRRIDEATAASDVAKGSVDVTTAESGIALALRFGPIIDLATERDLLIKGIMRQFAFDLKAWLKVYEGQNVDSILWDAYMGPKLPVDRAAEADRWQGLADAGFISVGTLHVKLRELGYDIPEGELANIVTERDQMGDAAAEGADLDAEAEGATALPEGE